MEEVPLVCSCAKRCPSFEEVELHGELIDLALEWRNREPVRLEHPPYTQALSNAPALYLSMQIRIRLREVSFRLAKPCRLASPQGYSRRTRV
jgi:hypothetical protein